MKKLFKLATLCLAVVLLTGCGMKAEYGIKISKDKDVTIEITSAQDDEMIDYSITNGQEGQDVTDEQRWEYLEEQAKEDDSYKDYERVKYDKDGYKGYTYKLKAGKIEDLVADGDAVEFDKLGENNKLFTKKGNVYSMNVKVSDEEANQIKQYAQYVNFDLKLTVTLPNKAKSNNATTVDGNTYTWDLTKLDDKGIELSFEFGGSNSNNIMLIAGGACAVIAIGICAFVLIKKKQK